MSLLREATTIMPPLESEVWRVDQPTRLGLYQSMQQPTLPGEQGPLLV